MREVVKVLTCCDLDTLLDDEATSQLRGILLSAPAARLSVRICHIGDDGIPRLNSNPMQISATITVACDGFQRGFYVPFQKRVRRGCDMVRGFAAYSSPLKRHSARWDV